MFYWKDSVLNWANFKGIRSVWCQEHDCCARCVYASWWGRERTVVWNLINIYCRLQPVVSFLSNIFSNLEKDRRQIFEVMDYQIHPNFRTETTTRNDIALLERGNSWGQHEFRPDLSWFNVFLEIVIFEICVILYWFPVQSVWMGSHRRLNLFTPHVYRMVAILTSILIMRYFVNH